MPLGDPPTETTTKRPKRQAKKRPFWIELPILIVIAFGLTFLIQTFVAKVYYVPSGSMEQTLHGATSGGDRILANKVVYDFRDPQQGDVVVFAGPETWAPEARIAGPTSWFGQAHAVARFGDRHRPAEREGLRQTGHRGRRPDRDVLRRPGRGDRGRPVAGRAVHLRADPVHSRPAGLHHDPDVPALLRPGHRARRVSSG